MEQREDGMSENMAYEQSGLGKQGADIDTRQFRRAVGLLELAASTLRDGPVATSERAARLLEKIELAMRLLSVPVEDEGGGSEAGVVQETASRCNSILDEALVAAASYSERFTGQLLCLEAVVRTQAILYRIASGCDADLKTPPPIPRRELLPKGAERRTSPRVPLETQVNFEGGTNFYTGFSQDISSGGLFVCTYDLQPIGTRVELTFSLPDGYTVNAPGQVRWLRDPIEPDPDAPPGMGIMFEELLPEDRRAIDEFVNLRAPLFYDDLV
jgi:uncharacterized protein (TIGR02266 family)